MAVGHAPAEDAADALADSPCGLLLHGPNGCKAGQHIALVNTVHPHVTQCWHGVGLQALPPRADVALVAPPGAVHLVGRLSSLPEGWSVAPASPGEGVAPLGYDRSALGSFPSSVGQTHIGPRTQPQVTALAVNGDPQSPRLRSLVGHSEVQAVPVLVPSRLRSPYLCCGELRHICPTICPTLLLQMQDNR